MARIGGITEQVRTAGPPSVSPAAVISLDVTVDGGRKSSPPAAGGSGDSATGVNVRLVVDDPGAGERHDRLVNGRRRRS